MSVGLGFKLLERLPGPAVGSGRSAAGKLQLASNGDPARPHTMAQKRDAGPKLNS